MPERPGNVMFVITSLDFGGAEAQVVALATGLEARGWTVSVVSLIPPAAYVEELTGQGVTVHSLDMRRGVADPRAVLRLASLYAGSAPDVVHSHMVHANILARAARAFAPVPSLVSTAHNVNEGGPLRMLGYTVTDGLAEYTTNVSLAGVEAYVAARAVPRAKTGFMPNGVDLQRFRTDPAARERLRAELSPTGAFSWLAVGRLTEQKDYPNLLRALALVDGASQLWVAGDGELRAASEALSEELGLAGRVRFLGIRTDVEGLMNAADGFVLSSAWEGLPMVLLEAAASELPIVATDVGGVSQVVTPGAGYLVKPRSPSDLAEAMARLEATPEGARAEMGRRSREFALANFDLPAVISRWEGLYSHLIARAGGRRTRRAMRLDPGQVEAAIGATADPV